MGVQSHTLAVYLRGQSQRDGDMYLMINGSQSEQRFVIQVAADAPWRRVIDTALDAPEDFAEQPEQAPICGSQYRLGAHSIAVLASGPRARTAGA